MTGFNVGDKVEITKGADANATGEIMNAYQDLEGNEVYDIHLDVPIRRRTTSTGVHGDWLKKLG